MEINYKDWHFNLRDEADASVFNEIFKYKEYRAADFVIKSAKYPIVDVGAHAGFFVFYCKMLGGKAKIFALEPEPNNLKLLQKHVKANKLKGVYVISGALAGESGKRLLEISADSHNHKLADGEIKENSIKVQAYSLADFCRQNKIKKISLLKMDIEGGEYEVFENLKASDLNMVNFIILEYHNGKEYQQIEQKLRENGFGVQIFPSKFDRTMGFLFAKNKRFNSI
ncbi:MAG: FkbM family methyltransferase [Patescibacteria group bacterium]